MSAKPRCHRWATLAHTSIFSLSGETFIQPKGVPEFMGVKNVTIKCIVSVKECFI